ncbi:MULTISPECIES: type II toxin-antitoxin system RelE/ParE family toxin [Pseudomonas]|uniref:type II toxin-antitoxin system RelE/ParE family toxin n=1 Tax=Pseudomonas TaxID=286 RepID=UPI001C0A88EC|nr:MULTISPECIES: type II toxin-antitoxin system RelE/ParE family toxin [Pseudomonas]MCK3838614.1 type II toxin-antitoxin system RelE/ParE family toxin [Pseudomonas sp. NCIMB 10586]MCK3844441.1 type II toxin-antitoxin system RelE/ParE family toxin [Pseudomonas sp. W15Feb34]VCU64056.1 Hypothetical new protein [Pseudomonas synxantha]
MTTLTIRYTEIAQQSIEDQVEHLAEYHSLDYALHRLDTVIDVLQKKLLSTPLGYPISSQASELGILHYRELNTDGYRVFYEIVEADQAIVVALVLRDKQSVEKALVRHCLLHT